MSIVTGCASNKVPTVQFGNVTIGPVSFMKPVPLDLTGEERINAMREIQREVEYVIGVEQRLLQWAVNPAQKFANPYDGDRFAAPPSGYDPASMPSHPSDMANGQTPSPEALAAAIPPPPSATS
jgi:hypothetical protein